MANPSSVALFAALAAAAFVGCTNNYGAFDFHGGTSQGGSSAQGGTSQGGTGAQGGSSQGGTGGAQSCGAGQMLCGGSCVATNDVHNCGGCNNDCAQLGLDCIAGVCGCNQDNQCGQGGFIRCRNGARCDCGGQRCRPGETCNQQGANQQCSCGGGSRCQFGETCCQTPAGCFNLQGDRDNCGACGHACPSGQNCNNGHCG